MHSRSAQESWASRSAHDRVDGKGSWFGWVCFFFFGFGLCVLGVGSGFSFILDLVSVPDLVSVFLVSVPDLVLYWIWFRSRI